MLVDLNYVFLRGGTWKATVNRGEINFIPPRATGRGGIGDVKRWFGDPEPSDWSDQQIKGVISLVFFSVVLYKIVVGKLFVEPEKKD